MRNTGLLHPLTLYDSMQEMLRRFTVFVFIVAALLAVQPVLHSHPLQQKSIPGACAVCATGVGQLPQIVPYPVAPQIIVYTLPTVAVTIVTVSVPLSLTSRAPPTL